MNSTGQDSTGQDSAGGDPLRHITRGPLATVAVLVVAAAIVIGGGFGLLANRAPTSSPIPSPSGAEPTHGTSEDGWAPIGELPPLEPVAGLTPTAADRAGIAPDSAFTLTALGATSAADLASGLTVEPAVALRTAEDSAGSVTITPSEPLAPGQRYRFDLRTPDDALAGSWAFTVKAPLHVVTTLPDDESTDVPVDTGIELTFDQDGVTGAQDRFTIEPAVEGRFETHGRTLVFVPGRLAPQTLYTVTLGAGVGIDGSDVTLGDDVRFRFETSSPSDRTSEPMIHAGRTVIEAAPDEPPVIGLLVNAEDSEGESIEPPKRLPVDVYRLPDLESAVVAARTLADAPEWATTSAGLIETDGLKRILHADVALRQVQFDDRAIVLPEPLPRGWYVLVIPRQGRDIQVLLQVTGLASYSLVSPSRSLFWVNEIDGGPLARVEVAIDGAAVLGKTGADGLLQVATAAALLPADDAPVLVTLTAPDGEAAIVPLGLTAVLEGYPHDIHAQVDPSLFKALAPSADVDALPAFARTAGAEVNDGAASGILASASVADPALNAILADTSGEGYGGWIEDGRYWSLLTTDRDAYRQTDTINLWGYLRDRDTLAVPASAEVRLLVGDDGEYGTSEGPPLATAIVRPRASGAFVASFMLDRVPLGSYRVQLSNDGRVVATHWISVQVIRKPAYELRTALDRQVRIDGQRVEATIDARFYEGTLAPGIELDVSAGRGSRTAVTGPDGSATARLTMRYPDYDEGISYVSVNARVMGAEEGEISSEAWVMVFPSERWLTADGTLDGHRLRLRGTVSEVDVRRLERAFDGTDPDYDIDPSGDPLADARVRIQVVQQVSVRRLIGQRYDFITKKVVPEYESDYHEKTVATRIVRSDADGRFHLAVDVPSARDDYQVIVTTLDARERQAKATAYVSAPNERRDVVRTYLDMERTASGEYESFSVGEPVRVTLRDDAGAYPDRRDSYLFVTAQRGLRDAVVQDTAGFRHTFEPSDAPNILINGVHFTGRTFLSAGAWADFDETDRTLTIRLETDRARYRPGETATITARTTRADGTPVAATVTLRGVDEKLYAIGAATEDDPLGSLYESVGDGLYRSYTSHPLPRPGYGNGGGDTGGGGRDDFRDTLIFRQFETGPDGVGSVTLTLADDLTSWHLSGVAVTAELEAGLGTAMIPVGLPFFVEATLAPEFVVADEPILRLRAFGSDLAAGDRVEFTVESPSLGMASVRAMGLAFEPVDVVLPALALGDQHLVISGATTDGTLSDRLTRTFTVVPARATRTLNDYFTLDDTRGVEAGPGLTTVVLSDAGRGRFVSVLEGLAWSDGPRLDQALAAATARDLLVDRFGLDASSYPEPTFDAAAYQRGYEGLALLPYSSASHDLTVRVLLADPNRFDATALRESMRSILFDPEASRERKIMALAGSALLGDEVLDQVQAAAKLDALTVRERLYLAVAAATLGDQATAIDLERALVAEKGERRGPWLRLADALAEESTSLLAIVMAEVGDPLAGSAEAYVEANPQQDDLSSLQQLAYAERALERLPVASSRFAYTVDGTRTVVELEPGDSRTLILIEPQARSLGLEPLAGRVGISVTHQEPLDSAGIEPDPGLTLTRKITPAGVVDAGQVVTVELGIRFSSQALKGCTDVVDQVPSGLAPIAMPAGWLDEDEEASPTDGVLSPYAVAGQRVAFCATPDPRRSVVVMRYHARVVSPGTYVWEPATAQVAISSELTTLTPATTIELR